MPKRSYQVTTEDKDFLTLSANLGVDYDALRAANPYVQSLSQGQNINLPFSASSPTPNNVFAPAVNAGSITGVKQPSAGMTAGVSAGPGMLSPSFSNTFSSASAAQSGMPQGVANFNAFAQTALNTGNPNAMSAYRNQEYITNQVVAVDQFFQQNGYLPANISPEVKAAMIAQGANPADIQKLQQEGAAAQASGSTDPLAGTPGHYYVDETTAPFVNRIIEVNGRRCILRQDKEGRLFYQKPGQSRRGRARNRLNARLAEQVLPPTDFRPDNPTTVLNVILGS